MGRWYRRCGALVRQVALARSAGRRSRTARSLAAARGTARHLRCSLARSQAAVLSAAGHSRRHAARSLARREGGKQTRNGLPHARRNLHSRLTDLVLWAIKLWMLKTEFYLLKEVRSKKNLFFDSKKNLFNSYFTLFFTSIGR